MEYEYKEHQFELAARSTTLLIEIYKITLVESGSWLPLHIRQIKQDEINALVMNAVNQIEAAAETLIQNNKGLRSAKSRRDSR